MSIEDTYISLVRSKTERLSFVTNCSQGLQKGLSENDKALPLSGGRTGRGPPAQKQEEAGPTFPLSLSSAFFLSLRTIKAFLV